MGMFLPFKEVVCPNCTHRFELWQAPRRAMTGPLEKDEHVGRHFGIPAPDLGRVLPAAKSGWDAMFNGPSDGVTKKICPECHLDLSHAMACGQSGGTIAVVGVRGSGKSNYLAVLLRHLERSSGDRPLFTFRDLETFSLRRMKFVGSREVYRDRYGKLFSESVAATAPAQNRSAAQDADLRVPLLYQLGFDQSDGLPEFMKRWVPQRTMDLVLFDAAGEDLVDPDTLDRFARYVLNAAGIIFLIDPFQFPGVREQLPPAIRQRFPEVGAGPHDLVSRVIDLFQKRNLARNGHRIPVPVAVAFSKSDLFDQVKGILPGHSRVFQDSRHAGGFDLADCRHLDAELRQHVKAWGGKSLLDLVDASFSASSLFAFSALGATPDEQLRLSAGGRGPARGRPAAVDSSPEGLPPRPGVTVTPLGL